MVTDGGRDAKINEIEKLSAIFLDSQTHSSAETCSFIEMTGLQMFCCFQTPQVTIMNLHLDIVDLQVMQKRVEFKRYSGGVIIHDITSNKNEVQIVQ